MISIEDKRFRTNSGVDIRGIARAFVDDIAAQRQRPGRLDDRAAVHQERAAGPVAPHDLREAPRGGARLPALAQVVQGKDHHRLPQHDLLRQRRLRDRGGRADLLRPRSQPPRLRHARARAVRRSSSAVGGGAARRHHPVADRIRPRRRTRWPPRNGATSCCDQMLEQGYLDAGRLRGKRQAGAALAAARSRRPQEQTVEGVDAGYFTSWVQQQVIERYGAPRAFDGGLQIKTTLDLELQRAAEQAVNDYLRLPRRPDRLARRDRKLDRRGARDGRRAQLRRKPVQPRHRGRAPAGLLVQGVRPRRRARGRHLARLGVDLQGEGLHRARHAAAGKVRRAQRRRRLHRRRTR